MPFKAGHQVSFVCVCVCVCVWWFVYFFGIWVEGLRVVVLRGNGRGEGWGSGDWTGLERGTGLKHIFAHAQRSNMCARSRLYTARLRSI